MAETYHHVDGDNPTYDEAKANARLIAAAPELLEALEWCVETFDGLAAVYPSLDNERGFVRVKAVIKKAKGENV